MFLEPTLRRAGVFALLAALSLPAQEAGAAPGATPDARAGATAGARLDWRQFGNLSLAGPASVGLASGPVSRVWYSSAGDRLLLLTASGERWETEDFENWKSSTAVPPERQTAETACRIFRNFLRLKLRSANIHP